MADEADRIAHPRTGSATGVMQEHPSDSRPVRRVGRTAAQDAAPLRPGALVAGRYRVERLIGVGGMGAVYEATQVAIDRRVALKVVRAEYADDPAMAARFQREAKAASAVRHPNIVMVHDFGQAEDGTLFMVMELLSGESLLQRMRRSGALPPREAVQIACEVLSALEAAHEAGVVHRDLKPDNVLLLDESSGRPGAVKVLDFGIARMVDRTGAHPAVADPGLTEVGQMLGTPRYMSPEAVARMPVGPAADLYALGAILFEMIAGRPVFTEKEPVILMGHHLRSPPPRLRDAAPRGVLVPRALDDLIDRLLAKMPTERPSSAAMVRKALLDLDWTAVPDRAQPGAADGAASGAGPVFEPPPAEHVAPQTFGRGKSRLRRAIRLSPLVLLAAGIAGLLYMHRLRLEERRQEQRRHIQVEVAPPPTSTGSARVETVRLTVLGAPANARVLWDDVEMPSTTFDVPRDDRPHELEVRASGYQAQTVPIVPSRSMELRISLERARRRPR